MKRRWIAILLCFSFMLPVISPVAAASEVTDGESSSQQEMDPPSTGCSECGVEDGHAETCSQYVAPITGCSECGVEDGHAETCSQYVAPITGCSECGVEDGHAETCSQYVAPKAERSVYEQMMAATTIEEMFNIMTTPENYDSVMALTESEIEALAKLAQMLPSDTGDEEYRVLVLDTLNYLPNSTLAPCAGCGWVDGHAGDCPVAQAEILLVNGMGPFPADGNLVDNATYKLTDNLNLTKNLTVPAGVSATIDLNGMVLNGTGTGYVITVSGYLAIIDSNPTVGHGGNINANGLWEWSTGNYNDYSKGGIIHNHNYGNGNTDKGIHVSGVLTMTGGMIAGCKGNPGPAITATSSGSVTLTGTRIVYNVSEAAGADKSGGVIHGEPSHSNTGSYLKLTNVTIANNQSKTLGGGIYGYRVELNNCTIENNSAATGGGVYLTDSGDSLADASLTVIGGSISNNTSSGHGGGIFGNTDSQINISGGAQISGNEAANHGGGIYGEHLTITGTSTAKVTISGNDALKYYGGGIYVTKSCSIKYGKIHNNYASACGGGIYSACNITIEDSEVTDNCAMSTETGDPLVNLGRGGGIYAEGGAQAKCTLKNSYVTGNAAMYYGGGVQICGGATLELVSGTISNNQAILAGAGGVHVTGSATFTLTGGEISGNLAHSVGGGIHSSYTCTLNLNGGSITNNTVYGRGGGVHVNTGGNLVLNGTAISENNAFDGPARIAATIDRENRTWTVVSIDSGSITPGFGGGVLINAGTCTMTKGTLSNNFAESGGGGIALIMSGFSVTDPHFSDCRVVEFTLTGGTISGNRTNGNGAGVYLMKNMIKAELGEDTPESLEGTPAVTATGGTVTGNIAEGNGGAVYQEDGTVFTISGTATFSYNTAKVNGGAVYIAKGTAEINGGTISNNTANGNGGGLFVGGAVKMATGTVSGNRAAANGGAVYVSGGSFTMENGSMNSNISAKSGGAAYISGGGFTMYSGTMEYNQATGAGSCGGAVYTNGGNIAIGVEDCGGTTDTLHTPYLNGGTEATHPVIHKNQAVFGGGLAVSDGVVNIYCCKIMENSSDNAGTGMNVFMEDTDPDDGKSGTLDIYEGAIIGSSTDHGIVVIGGEFTVHLAVDGKEVTIRYYPNYRVLAGIGENGEPWTGKAPDEYHLNLPYCPDNWITEQEGNGLAFVGWTDLAPVGGTTTVDLSFIREKDDYVPVGEPVQIKDETYINGVYYMDFYAVWAPLTSSISYQYALLPYYETLDTVVLKSLASVYDTQALGELTSATTGFTVNGTMTESYNYYTDANSSVSTSYSVTLPTVSKDQYEFKGWALYADTTKISNWGSDPDKNPTVVGGAYTWGNINHLVTEAADFDQLYQNALTVDRNFGDITLVAVFTRTHADLTIQNSGSGLPDTQSTVFTVSGDPAYGEDFTMTVTIAGDDALTIKDLPVGKYTITEQNDWTWRYASPAVTDSDGGNAGTVTVDGNEDHSVTFSDYELTEAGKRWLSANHHAAIIPTGFSGESKQN